MQVQSSLQQAVSVLRQYPYVMDINLLLEGLAKGAGEPEPAMLMQPSGVDDLQLVANWEPVVQYVEKINADGMHHHLSFLQNFC